MLLKIILWCTAAENCRKFKSIQLETREYFLLFMFKQKKSKVWNIFSLTGTDTQIVNNDNNKNDKYACFFVWVWVCVEALDMQAQRRHNKNPKEKYLNDSIKSTVFSYKKLCVKYLWSLFLLFTKARGREKNLYIKVNKEKEKKIQQRKKKNYDRKQKKKTYGSEKKDAKKNVVERVVVLWKFTVTHLRT